MSRDIPAILKRIKERIDESPEVIPILWIRRENAMTAVCTVDEMRAVLEWAEKMGKGKGKA